MKSIFHIFRLKWVHRNHLFCQIFGKFTHADGDFIFCAIFKCLQMTDYFSINKFTSFFGPFFFLTPRGFFNKDPLLFGYGARLPTPLSPALQHTHTQKCVWRHKKLPWKIVWLNHFLSTVRQMQNLTFLQFKKNLRNSWKKQTFGNSKFMKHKHSKNSVYNAGF